MIWPTLLALHIGSALVWWWLMPGGVALAPVIVLLLTALLARGRLSELILPPVLAAIPLFWMAFAVAARIVFFESFRSLWNLPFIGGAIVAALWVTRFRFRVRARWLVALLGGGAALAGALVPATLRAPDAATTPSNPPFNEVSGGSDSKVIKLSRDAQLHPGDGRIVIRRDKLVLNVQPMLSFADRSPDRAWISLAPAEENVPTKRTLVANTHRVLFYHDEDASLLEVSAREGAVAIEARSRLAHPIFSHTNSFAELTLQGHKKLSVSFSPTPKARIEIAPVSAAARFAYVDANEIFHVVQASELQRGPFSEIASGPLRHSDPLILTIYDAEQPVFTVRFDDWAAQASTQLSPTSALPVNVIELQRGGDAETSAVLISLSLADTRIGHGTQTVGHAAGVYRDRITVRLP